jgi:peptidoglycan/LPS O-acetylase OafA/YrhL
LGYTGVGLFLVISGFSIHLRWAERRDRSFSPAAFWRRRIVRLYPTYLIALVATMLVLVAVFGFHELSLTRHAFHDHLPVWASTANSATVVGANLFVVSLMPQAWSLALEEQIYALYSLMARFSRSLQPLRLLAASLALSLLWRLAASALASPGTARNLMYFQLPSRWFEWMLGLVAAEAYCGRLRLPPAFGRLSVAFMVIGGAGYLALHPMGRVGGPHPFSLSAVLTEPLFGVGFFVLLNWCVVHENALLASVVQRPVRMLATLGLASYSMYLLHPVIMRVVGTWVAGTGVLHRVVIWAAVVAGSYGFYRLVERRFVARASQVPSRTRVATSVAAAPLFGP